MISAPAGPKRVRRRPWQELRERRRKTVFLLRACSHRQSVLRLLRDAADGGRRRYTEATLAIFVAMIMDMAGRPRGAAHEGHEPVRVGTTAGGLISFGWRRVSALLVRAARSRPSRVVRRVLFVICGRSGWRASRHSPAAATSGTSSACPSRPAPGGMLGGHPAPREDLARWMRVSVAIVTYLRGAAHGLDVPLLELQGVRLGEAPARSHAADRRPGRDDRGHEARGVPLPRVRRYAVSGRCGGWWWGIRRRDAERSARQETFVREKEGQGRRPWTESFIFEHHAPLTVSSHPRFSMNAMDKAGDGPAAGAH